MTYAKLAILVFTISSYQHLPGSSASNILTTFVMRTAGLLLNTIFEDGSSTCFLLRPECIYEACLVSDMLKWKTQNW